MGGKEKGGEGVVRLLPGANNDTLTPLRTCRSKPALEGEGSIDDGDAPPSLGAPAAARLALPPLVVRRSPICGGGC